MYPVLAAALARAKERSGATAADDAYLTELLTLSAGTDPAGVTQYRPFLVAALWLEQNQAKQALKKAGDVEFTGLTTPIASLLSLQASLDRSLQLTVPKGFEALELEQSKPQPRYRTQSQRTVSRP
jgi:hypothetical protein